MAEQNMTATELKQWWDEVRSTLGFKAQHEGNQIIEVVVTQLLKVIEAQDARIKALESAPAIIAYPKVYKDQNGEFRVLLMDGSTPTFDEFKAQN